jgi:fluoroquinolone transport system permease protein
MNWQTLSYDVKLLRGDPMLAFSLFAPFVFWALMQFLFPLLAHWVMERWAVDLAPWYRPAGYVFMLMIPLLTGMVYGFVLLDERDGGIITAISVTPFGKTGYLKLRLGIPVAVSFLLLLLFQWLLKLPGEAGPVRILLLSALLASESLMILLFLGAFADNKVMGLAIAKGFAILLLGPLLDFILPPPLNWLGAYSPMFWAGRSFLSASPALSWGYLLAAFLFHLLLTGLLLRRFLRRND